MKNINVIVQFRKKILIMLQRIDKAAATGKVCTAKANWDRRRESWWMSAVPNDCHLRASLTKINRPSNATSRRHMLHDLKRVKMTRKPSANCFLCGSFQVNTERTHWGTKNTWFDLVTFELCHAALSNFQIKKISIQNQLCWSSQQIKRIVCDCRRNAINVSCV